MKAKTHICAYARRVTRWCSLFASVLLLAAQSSLAEPESDRPRVGLVLGGGGARGMAHLGVLQVLEEMRVPVDCIAGTSMGSLVGGLFASGVRMDDVIEKLEATDWDDLFNDQPPRQERPYRVKQFDERNLFAFELGMRDGEVLMPKGITAGYKFEFMLRELMETVGNFSDVDFDALPIPFRAVATNIEDGTSRVFASGDPVKAMRASMSVPAVIAPVELDGVLYVDGGLVNNIPVDAARKACADVVIAVDVGSPLLSRDKLDSALSISMQMVNVLIAQNVRESIASLGPDDILITPALGEFSSADFEHGLTLVPVGKAAARAQADRLAELAMSESDYLAWQREVRDRVPAVPPVTGIRVAATSRGRVNPEVLERELAEVPGLDLQGRAETDFELGNLNRRLEQVYGRGDFERMDYRMIDRPGSRVVEVEGVEKAWGPNYLKLGLGLASDAEQTRFNIGGMHRRTWLNDRGAEWRNYASLGFRNALGTEWYQPFAARAGAFGSARLEASDEPIVYFLDGRRVGDYRVSQARAHVDLGFQNKFGEIRAGLFAGVLDADEDFGFLPFAEDINVRQVGYTASIVYDQIDDPKFPRNGWFASLKTFGTDEGLGSQDEYNRTEVMAVGAISGERHGMHAAVYYGQTLVGDLPPYDPFLLGGFLRGSGFRMDELVGNRAGFARAVYSYRLAKLPPQLGSGVFVGGSLEGTYNRIDTISDSRPSASVFIGAETALGPIFLGLGQAFGDDSSTAVYLMLGNP
jgi:NTE family protein